MNLTFLFFNLVILLVPLRNDEKVKIQIKWTCDSKWKKIAKEEERHLNEEGKLVKWIQYTEGDSICDDFKYEYDGKKVSKELRKNCSVSYDKGTTILYKYGINGRVEEEDQYDGKKLETVSKFLFKLESDKFPFAKEDYYDNEKQPTSVTNLSYDTIGNLIKEEQLVSGSWFATHTFKFNSSGKLIYETGSADGGVGLVEYFYIYDKNVLTKDSVRIPDSGIEYHVYETH